MSLSNAMLDPAFTTEFILLVVSVFALILYAGMRLYSALVIIGWSFMVIIFIATFIYGLPILYLYFSMIVNSIIVGLASMQYMEEMG